MQINTTVAGAAVTIMSVLGATVWLIFSEPDFTHGQSLWKEYPKAYYPSNKGTVRVKHFKTEKACRFAMLEQLMASANFGNGIRYYCM